MALKRAIPRFPYVPDDAKALKETCYEAWNIQVQGLVERLRSTGMQRLVIGVSGGLDSTEALIVCVRAMEQLGLPRANIFAYTLPGFATSDGTKGHAWGLMRSLGVSAAEIDIRPAARQMLADMDHPFSRGEKVYDVTFENVQAGLRTDYLFRLANQKGALVVGTGDLSELGLGWCTYGVGDHMSHYNPNGSVSKTLIQHLIRFAADSGEFDAETATILHGVLASEISPELVPQDEAGTGPQSTQAVVGPYPLQDFNLFHLTRFGMAPSKIAYLSWNAWGDAAAGAWPADIPPADRRAYGLPEIRSWLALFLKRFFANQFKRSALPNGPKISSAAAPSPPEETGACPRTRARQRGSTNWPPTPPTPTRVRRRVDHHSGPVSSRQVQRPSGRLEHRPAQILVGLGVVEPDLALALHGRSREGDVGGSAVDAGRRDQGIVASSHDLLQAGVERRPAYAPLRAARGAVVEHHGTRASHADDRPGAEMPIVPEACARPKRSLFDVRPRTVEVGRAGHADQGRFVVGVFEEHAPASFR